MLQMVSFGIFLEDSGPKAAQMLQMASLVIFGPFRSKAAQMLQIVSLSIILGIISEPMPLRCTKQSVLVPV